MKLVLLFFIIAAASIFSTSAVKPALTKAIFQQDCPQSKNGADIDAELRDWEYSLALAEANMAVTVPNVILQCIYDLVASFDKFRVDIAIYYSASYPTELDDANVKLLIVKVAQTLLGLYNEVGRYIDDTYDNNVVNFDPLAQLEDAIGAIRDNIMIAYLTNPAKSLNISRCGQTTASLKAMVNGAFNSISSLTKSLNATSRDASMAGKICTDLPRYFYVKIQNITNTIKTDCSLVSLKNNKTRVKRCVNKIIPAQLSDLSMITNFNTGKTEPQTSITAFMNGLLARTRDLIKRILAQTWIVNAAAYAKCLNSP